MLLILVAFYAGQMAWRGVRWKRDLCATAVRLWGAAVAAETWDGRKVKGVVEEAFEFDEVEMDFLEGATSDDKLNQVDMCPSRDANEELVTVVCTNRTILSQAIGVDEEDPATVRDTCLCRALACPSRPGYLCRPYLENPDNGNHHVLGHGNGSSEVHRTDDHNHRIVVDNSLLVVVAAWVVGDADHQSKNLENVTGTYLLVEMESYHDVTYAESNANFYRDMLVMNVARNGPRVWLGLSSTGLMTLNE